MDLLISSNYNITDEKWSIVIKYWSDIKAVTLERIARIKYFPNSDFFWRKNYYKTFILWIKKLIKWININQVNKIIVLNFPFSLDSIFPEKEILYNDIRDHHLLHAFSTFYSSWFDSSAVLIVDWAWYEQSCNKEICYSIWKFDKNTFENLYIWEIKKSDFKFGIWYIYALHSLALKIWEWAIMWLSSYWNKSFYGKIDLFGEDFLLKDNYIQFFDKYKNSWNGLEDITSIIYEIYWINKNTEIEKNKLNNTDFRHIAKTIQSETEKVILELSKKAKKLSWLENLCIAGWVGLNILANTVVLENKIFDNLFIQPASDDTGLSLWWIYYLENIYWNTSLVKLESYWIWEEYSDFEIKNILSKYDDYLEYKKSNDIYNYVALLLSKSKIIWLFQWWSEFWPRALGFRSILARTDSIKIRNKINNIKNREYWRPLAPVLLEEHLSNYFCTNKVSPFMMFNSKIKVDKFSELVWVSHVDFSARYQTLNSNNNPFLYKVLQEFYQISGIPILINTSFNQHNEPIIESPKEAIEMFLSTDLDYLVMWNYVVSKKKKYDKYIFSLNNEYCKFFNNDSRILSKLGEIIFNTDNYKWLFLNWFIEFEKDNYKFTLSLIEYNIIWNKKKLLINFITKIGDNEKKYIMNNIKINKDIISKLLLLYYNDFIEVENVVEIIYDNNNFKL